MNFHKTVIAFFAANQYREYLQGKRIERDHHGHYRLLDAKLNTLEMSFFPTAKSGIRMIKRHLHHGIYGL